MAAATGTAAFAPLCAEGGYPTAIDALVDEIRDGESPRTLLELRIIAVAGAIRDRQGWWKKLSDKAVVSHWRAEACRPESPEDEAVFRNALAEVRWHASAYPGPARPAAASGTFSVDNMAADVVAKLLAGAEKVRASTRRDVHPWSDGLVVDLVHPSMYAYEQGVTPVLGGADVKEAPAWDSFIGNGTARPESAPGPVDRRLASPAGLAWLPAEFAVSASGDKCTINSYINSLHPREHKEMYDAIGEAFLVAVPLFEAVLDFLGEGRKPWEMPLRIGNVVNWVNSDQEEYVAPVQGEHPLRDDSDYDAEEHDDMMLVMPEVPAEFHPPILPPSVISLKARELQVIVKLSCIELTPEQPRYEGGTWHVEGMRNERIVATTCMYLEAENVTESNLEFRTGVCTPLYEQNDFLGVKRVLGMRNGDPLVQPRGTSRTLAGRALAWPNTLQHRVRPFELADKTRPGRRTILCFFLVDPTLRVRSTATVPPQIKDWAAKESRAGLVDVLPEEVRGIVASYACGMSFEDACHRRERLMDERRTIIKKSGEGFEGPADSFFERSFTLCEH